MSSDAQPLAARLYIAAMIAVGLALLVFVAADPGAYYTDVSPAVLALLALAVMVGEFVTVKMGPNRGEVAPSNTFAFALLLIGGPAIAIIAMFLACTLADLRDGKPLAKMTFNSSQYTIALYLSSIALAATTTLARPAHFDLLDLPGLAFAGAVFYGFNIAAVAIVIALHTGTPLRRQFTSDLAFHTSTEAILLGLAPLAVLAVDYSPAVLPLLVLPLVAINRAGRQAVVSERLALKDTLTDLPNRVMFRDRAEMALSVARRREGCASIMLMDLDRFKEINDTLGHQHGDAPARRIGAPAAARPARRRHGGAARRRRVRDPRRRAGGPRPPWRSREQLRRGDRRAVRARRRRLAVDASVGIALFPDARRRHRDAACSAPTSRCTRRRSERRGVELYDVASTTRTASRGSRWSASCGGRSSDGELVLHYQPQVDLRDRRRRSASRRSCAGSTPSAACSRPDEFIPLAEQTGLIAPAHTLGARDRAAPVPRAGATRGSTSPWPSTSRCATSLDRELPDAVAAGLLHGWASRRARSMLEITESDDHGRPAARDADARAAARDWASASSIDDFGTGYSSLAYLKRCRSTS